MNINGWTVNDQMDGHWMDERKGSTGNEGPTKDQLDQRAIDTTGKRGNKFPT